MATHDYVSTIYLGGSALSDFRAAALLRRVQEVAPGVEAISARYVHWVASDAPLEEQTQQALARILTYGEPFEEPADGPEEPGALVVVAPRLGTISPWASKATDIVRNCGIELHRVERVTEYRLTGSELTDSEWAACAALLHDRMTQTVLADRESAAALFAEREAEPMAPVDVLARGRQALVEADAAFGLALSPDEIDYLVEAFTGLAATPPTSS